MVLDSQNMKSLTSMESGAVISLANGVINPIDTSIKPNQSTFVNSFVPAANRDN